MNEPKVASQQTFCYIDCQLVYAVGLVIPLHSVASPPSSCMLSSRRKSETGLQHIIRPLQGYQVSKSSISVATRSIGGGKQSGRIMGIAESEEKQIGGGVGGTGSSWPNKLR